MLANHTLNVFGIIFTVSERKISLVLLAVFQREELPAEGGRGAPQSQVQLHHPDLRHLQRARVLLHRHRVYEQWLSGPAAPRGSYESTNRCC